MRHLSIKTALLALGCLVSAPAVAQTYQSQAPTLIQAPQAPAPYAAAQPYPAASAVPASTVNGGRNILATGSNIQLGIQGSYYEYREPSLNVRLEGPKMGFTASGTLAFHQDFFVTLDARDALGDSDYKGSGTSKHNFENLMDIRGMIGHDFIFNSYSFSPYIGIGYRQLDSDERGATSIGAAGYRRENALYYLPVGVTPRIKIDNQSRVSSSLEYDAVLRGNQTSYLSDFNSGYPDINNRQTTGYGLRGDIMYERQHWSMGPFLTYWHIDQSATNCAAGTMYIACGYEPSNHTVEGGLQARYKF